MHFSDSPMLLYKLLELESLGVYCVVREVEVFIFLSLHIIINDEECRL